MATGNSILSSDDDPAEERATQFMGDTRLMAPAGVDPAIDRWMARLLRQARRCGLRGEIPVAAALLDGRLRCLGWGSNRRQRDQDPLAHAELVALRQAARVRGDWRFNDCTLLVSLEPCPMCAGALVQARVGQVVYASADPKRGGLGSTIDLSRHVSANHHMRVAGGVSEREARSLLQEWFRQRRQPRAGTSGKPEAPPPEG